MKTISEIKKYVRRIANIESVDYADGYTWALYDNAFITKEELNNIRNEYS